jgi:hypothetical protein
VHDPGKIVADLAAAVALGRDCLADIAVLREQPELAGPVASDPVVSRLVSTLAADLPRALKAVRAARAAARERAWALAGDTGVQTGRRGVAARPSKATPSIRSRCAAEAKFTVVYAIVDRMTSSMSTSLRMRPACWARSSSGPPAS